MKSVAFVGLPNTGKSSWISKLTNKELYIANFSGATVDARKYMMNDHQQPICLIDVPGTLNFFHQQEEEKVMQSVFEKEHVDLIVQVINSTQLKASLPLTLQLRNLQIPMICLLNFSDEAVKNNIHIDTTKLSLRLSIPFLMVSSFNDEDTNRVRQMIEQCTKKVEYRPLYNPQTDRLFENYAQIHEMKKAIELFENHYPDLAKLEQERAIESCMRYVSGTMNDSNHHTLRVDQFMLCTFTGKMMLVSIIVLCFMMFLYVGLLMSELAGEWIKVLSNIMMQFFPVSLMRDFMSDVVFSSMGSLFSFVPLYMMISAYLAMIEESGLMARFLLLSERTMRGFHLNGKSLISLMIAHGCNVPAIEYASTMDDVQIRKRTVLLLPFCTCSARLAVYLMFASFFLGEKAVFVALLLILLGIHCVLLFSEIMACFSLHHVNELPLIELPVYRKVHLQMIVRKIIHQTKGYLMKLLRVLFCVFTIVFVLMKVQVGTMNLLEWISRHLSFVFVPLGFGSSWIYIASLLPGIIAKEAIVGTFVMLNQSYPQLWVIDPKINLIYLVYISLTVPCALSCATIQEKMGTKMMIQSIIISLCVSYLVCWLLYQFIMFF